MHPDEIDIDQLREQFLNLDDECQLYVMGIDSPAEQLAEIQKYLASLDPRGLTAALANVADATLRQAVLRRGPIVRTWHGGSLPEPPAEDPAPVPAINASTEVDW